MLYTFYTETWSGRPEKQEKERIAKRKFTILRTSLKKKRETENDGTEECERERKLSTEKDTKHGKLLVNGQFIEKQTHLKY
jgi:hypothetical protein